MKRTTKKQPKMGTVIMDAVLRSDIGVRITWYESGKAVIEKDGTKLTLDNYEYKPSLHHVAYSKEIADFVGFQYSESTT